jgi:ADP-ribosylglycohydrolase
LEKSYNKKEVFWKGGRTMEISPEIYRGCLLGMAAGDAMGAAIDGKTYQQICETYGPAGLLGYDLVNGLVEITSYTQVALFTCNGLLLSVAKGQLGISAYMRNISIALKEWARAQHLPGDPILRHCWLCRVPEVRKRRPMDPRTLDSLTRDVLGTIRHPANQGAGPGTLTAAVAAGLFFHPDRMAVSEIGLLGAQTVALTHGDPMAFLSGAALAYIIAGIVQAPECPMDEQILQGVEAVTVQFPCPQAERLKMMVKNAAAMAARPELAGRDAMERLECKTAAQVLAGAVYAVLASNGDFDTAMILAVNHSGKSAGVGAVTGALLGAQLGEKALPEFYLECLEGMSAIREIATDFYTACPKGWRTRLFDDEWDRKYTHGKPVDRTEQN